MMLESKSVSQAGGGGGLDIVQKNPFSLSENLDSDYCNSTKIIIKKKKQEISIKIMILVCYKHKLRRRSVPSSNSTTAANN